MFPREALLPPQVCVCGCVCVWVEGVRPFIGWSVAWLRSHRELVRSHRIRTQVWLKASGSFHYSPEPSGIRTKPELLKCVLIASRMSRGRGDGILAVSAMGIGPELGSSFLPLST